jgi:hypothetical protein
MVGLRIMIALRSITHKKKEGKNNRGKKFPIVL